MLQIIINFEPKIVYIYLPGQFKHLLWVPKRNISLKHSFESSQHKLWLNNKKINFQLQSPIWWSRLMLMGTKIFQYCPCPAGRVTYNFHSSFKHMHLFFKSVCNKEHKGVICNMTSSSNSS